MAEQKKDHAADAARMAMSQKHEVAYWTKKWGISEDSSSRRTPLRGRWPMKIRGPPQERPASSK